MFSNSKDWFSFFIKEFPLFEKIDLKDIVIAGGCIFDTIHDIAPSDIDLFYIP